MAIDRVSLLNDVLTRNPADAFARYALAMELTKLGRSEEALAEYRRTVELTPDYVPAYQMAGQLLIELERQGEARTWLEDGIARATRAGNTKARNEMMGLLDDMQL